MSKSFLCVVTSCFVLASAGFAELSYEVAWRVPGEGGFSAANALCDADSGEAVALVTCEGSVGVVCLDLEGNRLWEFPLEAPVTATPAVADIDGDGREDVVAGDSKGRVVALTADGELIWSAQVPARIMADSCPAIADLDGDGAPEVLVGDTSGTVSCLDNTGELRWRFQGDGTQMGPMLVADIYDSAGAEVVVTSHDRHLYTLTARGEWLWDLYFADDLFPSSTPILADVDGNDVPELYIGGGLHHFYRIDLESHQAVLEENVYLHINNSIAAADLDGDGKDEIVFGNKGGGVWCYGDDGFRWTTQFRRSGLCAAPTLVDLDDDAALEILLLSGLGDVQILDTDGSAMLSTAPGVNVEVAPLAGDLDGDGMLEVVASQTGGTSGTGQLVFCELGVPYREAPGSATTFAGNRARSGRSPGAKSYPLLAAPVSAPGGEGPGATLETEPRLFSGANTWRFAVDNPKEQRVVLLADIIYPDGAAHRFARHVHGSVERAVIAFDVEAPGTYDFVGKLVDGDAFSVYEPGSERLKYEGFRSDREYLESVVFAGIEEALETWERTNPRCAGVVAEELELLRSPLHTLALRSDSEALERLASLRLSADRLLAITKAGAELAPTGSFFAWEFCPWAYFDSLETLPSPDDRIESLEAKLCRGEYESLAVNVTNVCGRTLEVRVLCDAPFVELRRAVTVSTYRRELVSDALPLLDQGGLITVPPFETQQVWITVHAKDLPAGEHTAELRLKSVEPDPTEIVMQIRLSVHDLELPRPRPLRFCMWSYDGGELGTDNPAVLKELVEHGTTVFFGKSPTVEADDEGNLAGPLEFTAHDECVARLSPHGILLFVGPQGGVRGPAFLSGPWKKAFVAYLRAWVDHLETLGLDYGDWALYPYDEPSTPFAETTLNLVEVAKVVREADPDILIYTDPTSGTTMESVAMLEDLIDIWCPSTELLERLADELIPVAKRVGTEVWYYDAPGRSKTLSTLGHYRRWSWFAWVNGFTGAGWWTFAHHGPDRWDGPNETGNFYCTAYDGPGGVVTSKRWEAAREGIEDYEYLWLLREAVQEATANGASEEDLAGARALLEKAPQEMEAVLGQAGRRIPLTPDSVPLYEQTTNRVEELRQQIVEQCLALRR